MEKGLRLQIDHSKPGRALARLIRCAAMLGVAASSVCGVVRLSAAADAPTAAPAPVAAASAPAPAGSAPAPAPAGSAPASTLQAPAPAASSAAPAPFPFIRGVCWEAAGHVDALDIGKLRRIHANWISQTPFGWQRRLDRPPVLLANKHYEIYWGESDEGLQETSRLARARGIKVLLKPHIWTNSGWSGSIVMKKEADWAVWFATYRKFILHYADLAQRCGMDAFAVGAELGGTTSREQEWRSIIADVRKHYSGPIVYCANWAEDIERVRFWDALDWIGVQAYYPLTERKEPTLDDLLSAWRGPLADLTAVSQRWKKPVILTEVGYHSLDNAASRPWEWELVGSLSMETQARCYEALMTAVRGSPAIRGVFIWKWNPDYDNAGGTGDTEFTPERKPAETVLKRAYEAIEREGG